MEGNRVSLIKDLLGKDEGITYKDIKRLEGKYVESSEIECKEVPNDTDNNFVNDKIIKPLCGFLNKETDSRGLLILGAKAGKEFIEKLSPFGDSKYSASGLTNIVKDRIVPIGAEVSKFSVDAIPVRTGKGKQIILIEVSKTDPFIYYYNKETNLAYERRADKTVEIPLSELFKRVESKRRAKLIIYLEEVKTSNYPSLKTRDVAVNLINNGNLPGKSVIGFLRIYSETTLTSYRSTSIISSSGLLQDVSLKHRDTLNTFRFGPHFPEPLVYPGIKYGIGELHIRYDIGDIDKEGIHLKLLIAIFEERGSTTQEILLEVSATSLIIRPQPEEFNTYI